MAFKFPVSRASPFSTPQRSQIKVVEDVIASMVTVFDPRLNVVLGDPWYSRFIDNIYDWVCARDRPLTTEQARIVLRIFAKTRYVFVDLGMITDAEADSLQANPVYRNTPTLSADIPREVRYLGGDLLGFRFKRNDLIISELKGLKTRFELAGVSVAWDYIARLWVVPVTSPSMLEPIMKIISDHRFGYGEEVAEYLLNAHNCIGEPTEFLIDDITNTIRVTITDNELLDCWVKTALMGTPR